MEDSIDWLMTSGWFVLHVGDQEIPPIGRQPFLTSSLTIFSKESIDLPTQPVSSLFASSTLTVTI